MYASNRDPCLNVVLNFYLKGIVVLSLFCNALFGVASFGLNILNIILHALKFENDFICYVLSNLQTRQIFNETIISHFSICDLSPKMSCNTQFQWFSSGLYIACLLLGYAKRITFESQQNSVFNTSSSHIAIIYEKWVAWMKSKLYLNS